MESGKWRFNNFNYGSEYGLDTSDMETFKKDPVSSLAREICQNSIDAAISKDRIRVEFKKFTVARECIPGIADLTSEIDLCCAFRGESEKEGEQLSYIKRESLKAQIDCLRISDFNTKGIEGATVESTNTPFFKLTKGSGVSDKGGTSGGSKGIGKFASFVASSMNTVFYSTNAKDNTKAFIGISKLRSRPKSDNDPMYLTQGTGYFGSDERNCPILGEFDLDSDFHRSPEEYGTDIYIIGFSTDDAWEYSIVAKVLESFMVAIVRNVLEVVVEDITVNLDTIKEIIYNDNIKKAVTPTEYKGIVAQYELLVGGEDVSNTTLNIGGSSVEVYVKKYTSTTENMATSHCDMIRYPYMKITYNRISSLIPVSAMCIIGDNVLNKTLRMIENPQHTDWEINRLNNDPVKKKETKAIKNQLKKEVEEYIYSVIKESTGTETDIEGAGDYLPSQEDVGEGVGAEVKVEEITVKPITLVKPQNPKTEKSGENGEGYDFAHGEESDKGEEGRTPNPGGDTPNPKPGPKPEPKDGQQYGEGKKPYLKKVPLSGMKFTNIVLNKSEGRYVCKFVSNYTEANCELGLMKCGEATDKYSLNITSAKVNGFECEIVDGRIVGISIEKNKTYEISYSVDSTEMFASEVELNAYR